MKTVVLNVICSGCLQDKECVGTPDSEWYCEQCAAEKKFEKRREILEAVGWKPAEKEMKIFRIETTTEVTKVYEIEAEDKEDARDGFDAGDAVLMSEEDEGFGEEVDRIYEVKTSEKKPLDIQGVVEDNLIEN